MIAVDRLHVRAGAFSLADVSFTVPTGTYAVLMGATGCGKTTLLEAICGLKRALSGRIVLLGRDVTRLRPQERGVGYVPQDLALFPTLTVREHLAFALMVRRLDEAAALRRVDELAGLLGVGHLLDRLPLGLSGGEAQRVALGRALAYPSRALLLDEPLSALDEDTRGTMVALLRSVQRATGVTTLHVTHSLTEARQLADVLLRLDHGGVGALEAKVLVGVRYLARLKRAAGVSAEEVEVAAGCGVAELVARLAERRPGLRPLLLTAEGGLQPTVLVFVGDHQVGRGENRSLRDGDVLTLLTPIAGG